MYALLMDTTPVTLANHTDLDDGVIYALSMRGMRGVFAHVTADQARESLLRSSRAESLIFTPTHRLAPGAEGHDKLVASLSE